jgi:hypothetical protein
MTDDVLSVPRSVVTTQTEDDPLTLSTFAICRPWMRACCMRVADVDAWRLGKTARMMCRRNVSASRHGMRVVHPRKCSHGPHSQSRRLCPCRSPE